MHRTTRARVAALAAPVLCAAAPAVAQCTLPEYRTTTYAELAQVTGLDFADDPAFGDLLYASTPTAVYRVPEGGTPELVADGFTNIFSITFGEGDFAGYLYVADRAAAGMQTIFRIDAAGLVEPFLLDPGFSDLFDIAFGPGVGGWDTNMYVSDLASPGFLSGRVYRVTPAAEAVFFHLGDPPASIGGITFASGGAFGDASLVVADSNDFITISGGLYRFDPDSSFELIIDAAATDLLSPLEVVQGPGGPFGTDLYVTGFNRRGNSYVYRVTEALDVQRIYNFGSAYAFSGALVGDGDLHFTPDGERLLLADGQLGLIHAISVDGCPADLDRDGALTVFDFLAFQNAFDAGDPVADFDCNGAFQVFDFLAFQNAFDAGCP